MQRSTISGNEPLTLMTLMRFPKILGRIKRFDIFWLWLNSVAPDTLIWSWTWRITLNWHAEFPWYSPSVSSPDLRLWLKVELRKPWFYANLTLLDRRGSFNPTDISSCYCTVNNSTITFRKTKDFDCFCGFITQLEHIKHISDLDNVGSSFLRLSNFIKWSRAQRVRAPTTMILLTTVDIFHGLNCFDYMIYILKYCKILYTPK